MVVACRCSSRRAHSATCCYAAAHDDRSPPATNILYVEDTICNSLPFEFAERHRWRALTISKHMSRATREHDNIPLTKVFPSSTGALNPGVAFNNEMKPRRILRLKLDSPRKSQFTLAVAHPAETEVAQEDAQ